MSYFAHSGTPDDKSDWQSLQSHLHATASLAAKFAAPFGLERLAFVTALFHDLGKYDPRFQERLAGKNIRVDHSPAGAVVLRDLAKELDPYSRIMAETAAYGGADRNSAVWSACIAASRRPQTRGRRSKPMPCDVPPPRAGSPLTRARIEILAPVH